MAVVEGGGAAPKKTPSIGQPSNVKVLDWYGVKITVVKKPGGDYEIILPGGKRLPAGSSLNSTKKTIDLPGGKHLTFGAGKPVLNTPISQRDKLAPKKYTQVDYLTGKPVSTAPAAKPPRSGDDTRTPVPQPKPAPVAAPKPAAPGAPAAAVPAGGGSRAPGTAAGGGASGGAVGGSSGGGGGITAGPTSPAPSTKPLTGPEVDAEVRRLFGDMAGYLSHPELGPILRQAATEGWDNLRLSGKIQQTNYWKTTADSARKWEIVSKLDPATAKAQVAQSTQEITAFARQNGLTFDPAWLTKVATEAAKNNWGSAQIREALFAKASNGAATSGALDANVSMQYGYLAAFLDEPQIGDLLRKAARNGWSPEMLETELRKTDWWKSTSDSTRKWTAMREQNPEEAEAQAQNRAAEISALAQQAGIRLGAERLEQIAEDSMKYGWSQTQIKNAVTREYEFAGGTQVSDDPMTGSQVRKRGQGPAARAGMQPTPEGNEFGLAGQTVRQIKEMAGQYLVPISPQMMERWTEQIVRGETDMEGFNSYLVEQAKSLFPGMAGALDKGVTVMQYADPYRQMAARELEMAPESVDLMDPRFRTMLDQRDAKGNRVAMTLSESAEYLRKLPEWQKTRGANEKAAALTENILKTFGAVA